MTAEPAYQIDDAISVAAHADEDADIVGEVLGPMVLSAEATIDTTLDDLGGSHHSIAVHASADDFDTIVACGVIAGTKLDGRVVVAVAPVGDSTVAGVATFDTDESGVLGLGDEQVKVTAYLFNLNGTAQATPAV